ncbi:MAG: phosphoenolpyruvate carboxykinase (GTP), partial [Halanaerobiaceae bacterium]
MNISEENMRKLEALNNDKVMEVVEMAVDLCKPEKVTVITDDKEDINYVRQLALDNGEEKPLAMEGHTYHFDGPNDQARDKEHTKYLLKEEEDLGLDINSIEREKGIEEVLSYLDGSMKGKEMLVRFFSLGPNKSIFSIPAMQITDSSYVAHSEDILYRVGYEDFKLLEGSEDFLYFLHSAGHLENGVSADIDKRRIYIDLYEDRVFSVNNQYAGNSVGLKKLAFRLAIKKASKEGWLAEHMFISGVHGPDNRVTYFTGAFPSACGKTSTAMIPGNTVVGDDIAYLKLIDGEVRAVNVENGIFGIIRDVNPDDDPTIYKTLTTPRELIVSNVLVKDGKPYWMGMGQEIPEEGINYSGKWYKGKTDENGKELTPSHKNARYTIRIKDLDNCDEKFDAKNGVTVNGIVYGGRDSDTTVPVAQTLDWSHGVFIGACLESETTAATLGQEGVRKHNPMANLDFLAIPIGD